MQFIRHYTDKFLISELQRFNKEFGYTPKMIDLNKLNGMPSAQTYRYRFRTYNNALKLAGLKLNYYNTIDTSNKKCFNCGCSKDKNKHGLYYDINKNILCAACYNKYDYKFGRLSKESYVGKGFIAEKIIAKTLNIDKHCIELINFIHPFDLYNDQYKRIDVKSCKLLNNKGNNFHWNFRLNKNGKADTYILMGLDENRKNILKIWIINVNDELIKNNTQLGISNSEKGLSRFKQFEVDPEPFNETYHSMSLENCSVLRKN